jgi:DNA polymerase-1
MEYTGIKVDVQRLAELSRRFGQRMAALEQEIYQLAGHRFNIASPKQLQQLLFVEQKLPVVKRTPTGPSTDVAVLEVLALGHPLPEKIVRYRQYAKLKGTYVDALPAMVHPTTGRVHASFNQVVTATGRLSSSDPNLQNIPVRTDEGREIRSAFVPGHDGWVLLAADYSQIELRILAHFSGDRELCEAFERDEDVHARVASQVSGVPLAEVTDAMRRQAKTVNFGVIYGQSAAGLARRLGIERAAAAEFIDGYFRRYPGIEQFLISVLAECRRRGYVKTILGRRRAIRGVRENAGRSRNLPERTAVNTVIQGSAADLIKQAMIAIHRRLRREGLAARMLLQIHDELIFEVPAEELVRLALLVREEMAGAAALRVPLKVDLKAGPNWADAKAMA